jgi:L-2-hydroxycarboxylate dehydrogenase (NAD+)
MQIPVDSLRRQILNSLNKNFKPDDAQKVADYLVWAEMSGIKTQGIIKLTGASSLMDIVPEHEIQVEKDTKLSQVINGGKNPAPLVSQVATDAVIAKAKEHGIGIVGVHNVLSSNGAQAYYAERIAGQDLIGIVVTRSAASASAFGGIDPVFGTNPIGISFPTDDRPLTFDMATSAMTWYGLELAKARGEKIPENMAIDKDGNPTTSPEEAMDGSLLSFDRSYKGSGLAMVVEVLAGPLVGAAYGQIEGEWGSLFMAIDPELLTDIDGFKAKNSDLISKLKSSRKQSGVEEIRLPGERAQASLEEAESTGMVDVDDAILEELGYN